MFRRLSSEISPLQCCGLGSLIRKDDAHDHLEDIFTIIVHGISRIPNPSQRSITNKVAAVWEAFTLGFFHATIAPAAFLPYRSLLFRASTSSLTLTLTGKRPVVKNLNPC